MRHGKSTKKLGRTSAHRKALLAAQLCAFIEAKRVRTTLPKAKMLRRFAEKMVTLAKKKTLAARRHVLALLRRRLCVAKLFDEIAPACAERAGGYVRIVKLGRRLSDSAEMAVLEWVDSAPEPKKKKAKAKAKDEKTG
ncbi:MAG: 50S ribosomal protein L17 [Kiritimatiellae bacterium]|nr:50S ribosomal protein L17 [Kiritimatiellia bacterium]